MWHDLLVAIALMLVIEGVLPFLNPALMRQVLLQASELDDKALRTAGFSSMLVGVLLLYFLR